MAMGLSAVPRVVRVEKVKVWNEFGGRPTQNWRHQLLETKDDRSGKGGWKDGDGDCHRHRHQSSSVEHGND